MSLPHPAPTAPAAAVVPTRARALAARLAALFDTDSEVLRVLNDAQHLLARANDWLCCAPPAADPLRIHQQIDRAFWTYQQASEQRRHLAVDVGELSQQLADVLTTAGYSRRQARSANVHELAAGTWQAAEETKETKR